MLAVVTCARHAIGAWVNLTSSQRYSVQLLELPLFRRSRPMPKSGLPKVTIRRPPPPELCPPPGPRHLSSVPNSSPKTAPDNLPGRMIMKMMLTMTTRAIMRRARPRRTRVETKPRQLRILAPRPSPLGPSPRRAYPDLRSMSSRSRGRREERALVSRPTTWFAGY